MRRIGGHETERHVLVDGNNLIHRAYYAYVSSKLDRGEPLLSGPDGYSTGVIYGSLSMLSNWLYSIPNITKISVFFDGSPKRRKALDSGYKANRELSTKLGLANSIDDSKIKKLCDGYSASCEIDVLSHVFSLLGCDIYHNKDEEADDLIASFCRSHPETVRIIISADKDFFQLLVDSRIACYIPGIDGDRFFDAEKSTQHWARLNKGNHPPIQPSHVRMFKTLCGDSSDGIYGVDRLRKKVAASLCHHDSVDALYASGFPGMSKAEREKTIEMRDRIDLNYKLVGFDYSIDLSSCIKEIGRPDFLMAQDILRQDLDIYSIDISPFKIKTNFSPVVAEPIPVDAWLQEILS